MSNQITRGMAFLGIGLALFVLFPIVTYEWTAVPDPVNRLFFWGWFGSFLVMVAGLVDIVLGIVPYVRAGTGALRARWRAVRQ